MPKIKLEIDTNVPKVTGDFRKLGAEVGEVDGKTKLLKNSFTSLGKAVRTALAGTATLLAMKQLSKVVDDVNKQMEEGAKKTLNFGQQLKGLFALGGQSAVQQGIALSKKLAEQGIAPAQTLQGLQSTISGAGGLTPEQHGEIIEQAGALDRGGAGGFEVMRGLITRLVSTNPETFKGKTGVIAAANFAQKLIKESGVLADEAKAGIKPLSASETTGVPLAELGGTFAVLTQNKVSADESATAIESLAFRYSIYIDKGGTLSWPDWLKAMSVLPKAEQIKMLGDIGGKVIGLLGSRTGQISEVASGLTAAVRAGEAGRSVSTSLVSRVEAQNPRIALSNLEQKIRAKEALELSGLEATGAELFLQADERAREKNRAATGSALVGLITGIGGDNIISRGFSQRGDELFGEVNELRSIQSQIIAASNTSKKTELQTANALQKTNSNQQTQGLKGSN